MNWHCRDETQTKATLSRLAEEVAGIASHEKPQTLSLLLKPRTTNTLIFDVKNELFELFEDLFKTMIKMQPEMTEKKKRNHFDSHLSKQALQTNCNKNAGRKRTHEDVLIIFQRRYVRPSSPAAAKHKWHKLTLTLSQNHYLISSKNSLNVLNERSHLLHSRWWIVYCTQNYPYTSNAQSSWLTWKIVRRSNSRTGRTVPQIDWVGNGGPISTMETTTATVNEQNQPQNVEQQHLIYRYGKKSGQILEQCRKRIRKKTGKTWWKANYWKTKCKKNLSLSTLPKTKPQSTHVLE